MGDGKIFSSMRVISSLCTGLVIVMLVVFCPSHSFAIDQAFISCGQNPQGISDGGETRNDCLLFNANLENEFLQKQKLQQELESEDIRKAEQAKAAYCRIHPEDASCASWKAPTASGEVGQPKPTQNFAGSGELASACQSKASAAVTDCGRAGSILASTQSKLDQLTAQMSSAKSTNPIAACTRIANISSQSVSELQNSRGFCQSAVSACSSSCTTAVSASAPGSSAAAAAAQGKANCSSTATQMSGIDTAIARMQNLNGQADSCVASATGSSPKSTAQDETIANGLSGLAGNRVDEALASANSSSFDPMSSIYSNESYTGPVAPKPAQLSAADAAAQAAAANQSGNSYSDSAGKPDYRRSKTGNVDQKSGHLASLGNGAGASDDARLDALKIGNRPRFEGTAVNAGYLGGDGVGGANGRRLGGQNLTAAQLAAQAQARRGLSVGANALRKDANGANVDLRKFLPTDPRLMRVGGRVPANDGAILRGPHTNMFKTVNSCFMNLEGTFDP